MKTKRCSKCGDVKGVLFYGKDNRAFDGLSSWCKACKSKSDRDHYEKNKAWITKRNKEYAKRNQVRLRDASHRYYLKHKERFYEMQRKRRKENPDERRHHDTSYRKKNREKIRLKARRWMQKNVRELGDSYIKACICQKTLHLRHSDIPQQFVDSKREEVRLNRILKEMNQ